jgi:hypothetical protein
VVHYFIYDILVLHYVTYDRRIPNPEISCTTESDNIFSLKVSVLHLVNRLQVYTIC